MLFCHSRQYLYDDAELLNDTILKVDPTTIVTVTNDNDDLLGELIRDSRARGHLINPEEAIPSFPPPMYKEATAVPFLATVSASTFSDLAWAITYLLDVPGDKAIHFDVETKLRQALPESVMTIRQTIRLYTKYK